MNKENQQRREKLEAFEAAEEKRKEAEMSELELAQKKLADLEAEHNQLKLEAHQATAAAEAGLPPEFAGRIKGATIEEMNADAKALFDLLPVKPKANPRATNPNIEQVNPSGETLEQKNRRLGLSM